MDAARISFKTLTATCRNLITSARVEDESTTEKFLNPKILTKQLKFSGLMKAYILHTKFWHMFIYRKYHKVGKYRAL